jgi:hypothetical protein
MQLETEHQKPREESLKLKRAFPNYSLRNSNVCQPVLQSKDQVFE